MYLYLNTSTNYNKGMHRKDHRGPRFNQWILFWKIKYFNHSHTQVMGRRSLYKDVT